MKRVDGAMLPELEIKMWAEQKREMAARRKAGLEPPREGKGDPLILTEHMPWPDTDDEVRIPSLSDVDASTRI